MCVFSCSVDVLSVNKRQAFWVTVIAHRLTLLSICQCESAQTKGASVLWRAPRYVKGDTVLNVTPRIVEEHLQKMDNRLTILIDPARLHWTPYVASPTAGRR